MDLTYFMDFDPFEAFLIQPGLDDVLVPAAPRTRPVELAGDDDPGWYNPACDELHYNCPHHLRCEEEAQVAFVMPPEAPFFHFEIDIVPVPPAPRMRSAELPGDDEPGWYIPPDAPMEEGNALRLFIDETEGDVGFIAPPPALEQQYDYPKFDRIQKLLESVNGINEALQNLQQNAQNGYINLDDTVIDLFQEARNLAALELINTVGHASAHPDSRKLPHSSRVRYFDGCMPLH
ncbi:uncharacterized protein FOMMEDRAFT_167961 [Fomitiporia mediterranea MF3/22]|uniref:uncharacterized protein n=1 Tax=Fomitiporia mediterranea (strain MF3/22) TaxID=694068 RepID=UPI0004409B06|nr:uncharacterized protein FOMMEDRAFT_167961 [Fomitiporia mediterranea MF3/22]EJD02815.1 hypothetical protein FOMMEDRAFT_167961 [Fomitiporia mediterranea MF3/22]